MYKYLVVLLVLTSLISSSCGRQYAKGEYIDPDTIILRSDKFVDSDLKIIADRLASSLVSNSSLAGVSAPPAVIMSKFTNSTDEHIDMQSLSEKILVNLFKSGKVRIVNAKLRKDIEGEHQYQEAGFVDPETAVQRGKQIGAKYLISGNIASIKQPVGRQEIVYYKATLELTKIRTGMIDWMDEVEIKKKFRKKFTGF